MNVKVVKFGGSSLADAEHFKQVASIIKADPHRRYVVPSAPGKRFKEDTKVTDMLYECYERVRNHEDIDELYARIVDRYNSIIKGLGMDFDIALVGCGAYGFPLSIKLKQAGKQVIHVGGALQVLFGIKGARWDNSPKVNCLYNEHWVRPGDNERPADSKNVEGACYW